MILDTKATFSLKPDQIFSVKKLILTFLQFTVSMLNEYT